MIATLQKHSVMAVFLSAAVALLLVFKFQYWPFAQFGILATLVFIYLTWAFVYHHLDRSWTLEVAAEYILTALLAIVILYGILV